MLLQPCPKCSFRTLIKNENFDTRDFTIFIAKKNWVRSILRPLLELCAKNDRYVVRKLL